MQSAISMIYGWSTGLSLLLILLAIVYGLFGWRVVRYLAVTDATAVAVVLALTFVERAQLSSDAALWYTAAALCLGVLPWLAWRFSHWAVVIMCAAAGFMIVQMPLIGSHSPTVIAILLGAIGAAMGVAMRFTMSKETAIIVTGLHGGCFLMAALALSAAEPGSLASRLFTMLTDMHAAMIPIVALTLAAIMISLQWADLEREVDPFCSRW